VAPEQDAGSQPLACVILRDPDGDRSLARASHSQVSDSHSGKGQIVHLDPTKSKPGPPDPHPNTPQSRQREQGRASQPRIHPAAGPQPANQPVGIAAPSGHAVSLVTSSRLSRARASAVARPRTPGSTKNGAPYAIRTFANGFGISMGSHDASRQAGCASA